MGAGKGKTCFERIEIKDRGVSAMNLRKVSTFSIVLLSVSVLFYLFFAFFDGAVICVDSPSYIGMQSSREPLYPLILAFFRWVFQFAGEGFYLEAVVFFQSILAAVAAFSMEEYLRKELNLSKACAVIVLIIPMAVSLLCRFAAKRGSMYSNSILTEGITISLYLIFFRFLIEYMIHHTGKCLRICGALTLIMLLTRKQMMFALAMLLLAVIYVSVQKKNWRYGVLNLLICSILILGMNTVIDKGYNYAVRGEALTHSSDVRFVATVAFYVADREDAERIENPGFKELFLQIYDSCNEQGYLRNSAGQGWNNRVSHFGDYYDCIQIDTMWPAINRYVEENYDCRQTQVSYYADQVMKEISMDVLPAHIGDVISVFVDNFRAGAVTTIAKKHPLLNWYSVFAYAAFAGMLIACFAGYKDEKVRIIAVFTLLSIILNVGLVSIVIFCQTRYTIYNMALFYISMVLMADTLTGVRKR